ncbi:hypothetical protein N7539_005234 [Penicillium diatomitis]|uniref:ML-like domain-containing protein n=1 Tax=Penicillium diatomitis TaxID=2819901 RepID=A0A9W9X6X7_9EURO|nr:uncharacterized protein N7539_005234 [Penicillium diatomitis]KAJ5485246.1 hypothetical protein N7539_005234 [Penicillium diatomitis]
MRFSVSHWLAASVFAFSLAPPVAAERLLQSHALIPCSNDGIISVNHFDIVFTPSNNSALVSFDGQANYAGNVYIDIALYVYGYKAATKNLNPCALNVDALCPLRKDTALKITNVPLNLDGVDLSIIPGIAYTMPDLDAVVRLQIINSDTGKKVTCVEAQVNNGVTVDQAGVAWSMAVLIGIGLFTSVVLSILGRGNLASHVAFRTLLFLSFMQIQAIWGLTAIKHRPLVQSWTQIWQWTMGLVGARALQTIATWFQRSTGGTPSKILAQLNEYSVIMQKRSMVARSLVARATDLTKNGGEVEVSGIERVGIRINIEPSNIFMTSYLFFYFVTVVFLLVVLALKLVLPRLKKTALREKPERTVTNTSDWKDFMRGHLYWMAALGYSQLCCLGLWELVHQDSAAEIVLAICMWLTMTAVLCWAMFKVFQRARLSRTLRQDPAYTLYSDPVCLTRWGILYVNYRARTFWFMVPMFLYTLVKGATIAFGQSSPLAQAIVLLIVEIAFLVATAAIRPFMSKTANIFAITTAAINFLNAIFFLFFTEVFGLPMLVSGVMEVIFFILNALFMLALLVYFLMVFYNVITLKEPTVKYTTLPQDRSSTVLTEDRRITELEPLEKNLAVEDGHAVSQGNEWQPASSRSASNDDITPAPHQGLTGSSQPTLPSVSTSGSDTSVPQAYTKPHSEERIV